MTEPAAAQRERSRARTSAAVGIAAPPTSTGMTDGVLTSAATSSERT